MNHTEIAISKPFEGMPKINTPKLLGVSKGKPILIRIAVTGERPVKYAAQNLPQGLTVNENIISGQIECDGIYTFTVTAENKQGKAQKELTLEVGENKLQPTPLMGFTSWNAFGSEVTQKDIEKSAKLMVQTGICEYGYNYINTDSGWQKEYGGKFDAIMPNDKFPDMKRMCDTIHEYGFKAGIYSTPMLKAWGCPKELPYIPGCTVGEPDELFSDMNTGIGKIRKEKNNALQWAEWGFDYLKYDWTPCDPYNAELMRCELLNSTRDFTMSVTVGARPEYTNYWSKYINSYRNNHDSLANWRTLVDLYNSYKDFTTVMQKGHFFDLDMLDTGTCLLRKNETGLTLDEQILAYSLRAFMGSPIQISSILDNISEFELSLYCNEEIIAINQDTLFSPAKPLSVVEAADADVDIYKRKLENGDIGYCIFNLGDKIHTVKIYLDDICKVRDVWAKKDYSEGDVITLSIHPHAAKIFRATKI